MILYHTMILIPLSAIWILFSYYLVKKNLIVYVIKDENFLINYMRKKYEVGFEEINCIIEYSNYTNPFKGKKYKLELKSSLNVFDRILIIENEKFTKWLSKQSDRFKIVKQMFYD